MLSSSSPSSSSKDDDDHGRDNGRKSKSKHKHKHGHDTFHPRVDLDPLSLSPAFPPFPSNTQPPPSLSSQSSQPSQPPRPLLPWSQPSLWGRPTWMFLYCVVKTFPERPSTRQKQEYLLFFHSMSSILPCKLCRRHYRQWLRRHPIEDHLGRPEQLEAWLLDLHNYIRQRLHKPPIPDFRLYFS